jgi:hypothetical protein
LLGLQQQVEWWRSIVTQTQIDEANRAALFHELGRERALAIDNKTSLEQAFDNALNASLLATSLEAGGALDAAVVSLDSAAGLSLDAVSGAVKCSAPASKPMITVIGSLEDTAKYVGEDGYNVLNIPDALYNTMTRQEFDRYNALWLNTAIQRGDIIMALTDPAMHAEKLESVRPGLSLDSRYLTLELPMLQVYEIVWQGAKIAR